VLEIPRCYRAAGAAGSGEDRRRTGDAALQLRPDAAAVRRATRAAKIAVRVFREVQAQARVGGQE
jgi:hypothetical protein